MCLQAGFGPLHRNARRAAQAPYSSPHGRCIPESYRGRRHNIRAHLGDLGWTAEPAAGRSTEQRCIFQRQTHIEHGHGRASWTAGGEPHVICPISGQ